MAFALTTAALSGVTLKVYDNMGLSGVPRSTAVLDTTSFSLPSDGKPFSAELTLSLIHI